MRRALLTLTLTCSFSQAGWAQDQDRAPMLNAFGRFWGIGYSAGYHARTESRFGVHRYTPEQNVVPQPPRGLAAIPSMHSGHSYGSATSYGSQPAHAPMNNGYAGSTLSAPTPAPMPAASQSAPAPATKPVEPPPNWLKQYIKPNGENSKSNAEELLNDNSPSDRKGVMLTPSASDSTTSISITPSQPTVQIGGRPVISVLQQ